MDAFGDLPSPQAPPVPTKHGWFELFVEGKGSFSGAFRPEERKRFLNGLKALQKHAHSLWTTGPVTPELCNTFLVSQLLLRINKATPASLTTDAAVVSDAIVAAREVIWSALKHMKFPAVEAHVLALAASRPLPPGATTGTVIDPSYDMTKPSQASRVAVPTRYHSLAVALHNTHCLPVVCHSVLRISTPTEDGSDYVYDRTCVDKWIKGVSKGKLGIRDADNSIVDITRLLDMACFDPSQGLTKYASSWFVERVNMNHDIASLVSTLRDFVSRKQFDAVLAHAINFCVDAGINLLSPPAPKSPAP